LANPKSLKKSKNRNKKIEKFDANKHEKWKWDLMIMQAYWINAELIEKAKQEIAKKKHQAKLDKIKLETLNSHKAVKTLHIGVYDEFGEIYKKLEAYINENGLEITDKSQEIYLSIPRRTAPEKLKTIVFVRV